MAASEDVAVDAAAVAGFGVADAVGLVAAAGFAAVWAPCAGASTSASTVQNSMVARRVRRSGVRECWFMGFSKLVVGIVSGSIVDSCAAGLHGETVAASCEFRRTHYC
jgi:hypothetical protein